MPRFVVATNRYIVGIALALGRRTVTSRIRAAGLVAHFRRIYATLAADQALTDEITDRVVQAVIKPRVANQDRMTLALDDTRTRWHGWHGQGAVIHNHSTPGPAMSPFVCGQAWVVFGSRPPP